MALAIDRPNNDVFIWFQSTDVSSANTANISWMFPAPCNGRIANFFGVLKSSINNDNNMIISTTQSGLGTVVAGGTLLLASANSSVPTMFSAPISVNAAGSQVREGDIIQVNSSQNSSNAAQANFCIVIRR